MYIGKLISLKFSISYLPNTHSARGGFDTLASQFARFNGFRGEELRPPLLNISFINQASSYRSSSHSSARLKMFIIIK